MNQESPDFKVPTLNIGNYRTLIEDAFGTIDPDIKLQTHVERGIQAIVAPNGVFGSDVVWPGPNALGGPFVGWVDKLSASATAATTARAFKFALPVLKVMSSMRGYGYADVLAEQRYRYPRSCASL